MIGKYFVLLVTIGAAAAIQKVPVSIYYETLCADSMTFFTKQFVPTWKDLKAYIDLKLVPFGKSKTVPGAQNLTFECHHGANECLGNKFQSCLIDPVYRHTEDDIVSLIDCLMKDATKEKDYAETALMCKRSAPAVDVTVLVYCAKGQDGDRLLLANQEKTNAIQAPLKSVPTIVLNQRFDENESKEAEKSFRSVLCKYITDNPKPKLCEVNGAPTTTVGLITLFAAGLVVRML